MTSNRINHIVAVQVLRLFIFGSYTIFYMILYLKRNDINEIFQGIGFLLDGFNLYIF